MLLWLGDPKTLSEHLGFQVPLIRITQNMIIRQDTKEKHAFPTPKAEKDAANGLKELQLEGLIKTDHYGDTWLTEKGRFLLGTRQGYFPNPDIGPYFI